ncbi:hypothetical protein OUZ56_021862 [Daphnia magna]|uniref:Uncharacterized protein n=1 Tax=Daphnia magna TaxID=35525 RepID=A0ABR0AUN8_9CRUS|nr:hypothetical protein OUZ56_021862 [Daphnia magna]
MASPYMRKAKNASPYTAYGLPIIIHLVHDPSNHTDKNIQSVYYSARGITRDTLNRTDLPT